MTDWVSYSSPSPIRISKKKKKKKWEGRRGGEVNMVKHTLGFCIIPSQVFILVLSLIFLLFSMINCVYMCVESSAVGNYI